ncbi:MAG: hypothetical protein J3Q66DRAFT_437548 [Benniella sp.]|nr:MAG: hypothetical protein J3Q66DRAFT_437548 [Benniella sp.]
MKRLGPVLAQLPCVNIRRLDFTENNGYMDVRPSQLQVLQALERIPTLRHLQIKLALDKTNVCQQWMRVLESLPHLVSLSLSSELIEVEVIQKILQLCIGYERLELVISSEDVDDQEYQDTRVATERMPEMRLRELSFDSDNTYSEKNSYGEGGLETLGIDDHVGNRIVQSIAQYHHQSLRRLNFLSFGILHSTLSGLMTQLPNLRTLEARLDAVLEDDINSIPIDNDWVCVGLRSLQLEVNTRCFRGGMDSSEWKRSIDKRGLDYVFSKTVKMKSLQGLSIGCRQRELYLMKAGYLTQLGGLKQLEAFGIVSIRSKMSGRNEALWMANNWPKLVQVYSSREASEIVERTLLEERPLVEIVYW